MAKKLNPAIVILVIVAAFFALDQQGFLGSSFSGEDFDFETYGFQWTCNAIVAVGTGGAGDSDFSNGDLSIGHGEASSNAQVDQNLNLRSWGSSRADTSQSEVICSASILSDNVQEVLIVASGTHSTSQGTNPNTAGTSIGTSNAAILYTQDRGVGVGSRGGVTIQRIGSTSSFLVFDPVGNQLTDPNFDKIRVRTDYTANGGNGDAQLSVSDIIVTCNPGFIWGGGECFQDTSCMPGDGDCDGVITRAELGAAIGQWLAGTMTRTDLGNAIQNWLTNG